MLTHVKDWMTLEKELLQKRQKHKTRTEKEEEENKQLDTIRGKPMLVATLDELLDEGTHAIVSIGPGDIEFFVPIRSIVDKELLEPNCKVLLNTQNFAIVGVLQDDINPLLHRMKIDRAPNETFADIGVILYGVPGTGKTLLAKAVANSTSATFLHVVGSEFVQKVSGEGPKLVRDMFALAEEYAPTIIFIDEVDSIGGKRDDSTSSGDKEVQRTMLELLNQLDGFDKHSDIKVIMATNRIDILDPALIRPGRIDRKIEIPKPDEIAKRKIFELNRQRMACEDNIEIDNLILQDDLSGADIKAMCTEAGFLALRERRMKVSMQDFLKAKERVLIKKSDGEAPLYL
ncbi:26S proteasome regulatory complex: ATPase RPT2-like protein [Leptotrombidium deliense]|uniref:26S proteasome regulatory complex: ATPase RPT2-like protein n=1 Tax=Leptotrombidium deliense TaxID=299467 RepID=A0A443SPI4_9ACAR|nr:26S proteasome regulatory complex: ATPase RPT2-like protein [Leptotrombidium deliense]